MDAGLLRNVVPWFPPGDVSHETPPEPQAIAPPPDVSVGPFDHLRRQAIEHPVVNIFRAHLGMK